MKNQERSLLIFYANHDWRNIFQNSFHELHEKLERDRMNADLNSFFFFSYAHVRYVVLDGQYRTAHIKTYLKHCKPLLDFTSIVRIPFVAWKYGVRPDVWVVGDFGTVLGARIAKRLFGGLLVMSINNQPTIYARTRKFGAVKGLYIALLEHCFHGLVDHYFTINQTLRSYLLSIGVSSAHVSVFSMNTIDRDVRDIKASRQGVIRAQYNISIDTKILLTVARLEVEKNYPELLRHFAALGPGYVLFALGRGSMLVELQEQSRGLGVADRVFFPGYVERKDIWNYYQDADVFVLISKAEALGVVLWEAMYLNVPVVGSNVEGILESLGENGERGLVWKQGESSERFCVLISKALSDSEERTRMLKEAKEYVEAQLRNITTINSVWKMVHSGT